MAISLISRVGPHGYIHGWIFVGIPAPGDHVIHPHHGHGTVTEASSSHVKVRFDSGGHHVFPVRPGPGPGHFEQMTDEELVHHLTTGQGQKFHNAVAELDRRDRAIHAERVRSLYAETPRTAADRNRIYQGLVNEGENPEDAWSHAHGADTAQMQREAVIAQLRTQGYKGSGFDALTRDAFKHEVQRRVLDAEAATNGYMLSRDGQRAGVDPWSLFTGPEARARKYASPELREWWDQNGRPSAADFQDTLMGHKASGPRGGDYYRMAVTGSDLRA
jgi:hypothetical protein